MSADSEGIWTSVAGEVVAPPSSRARVGDCHEQNKPGEVAATAWALDIPLEMTVDDLRAYVGNQRLGGVLLATVAVLGALLTTGLVRPWGEIVPGWVPVIGKRRIPPGLAIVPASLMAIVIASACVAFVRGVLLGEMPFGIGDWGVVGPTLLWPVWGAALGVATLAYYYRRRGRCRLCGRGATGREEPMTPAP